MTCALSTQLLYLILLYFHQSKLVNFHSLSRLRMIGVTCPLSHIPSWHAHTRNLSTNTSLQICHWRLDSTLPYIAASYVVRLGQTFVFGKTLLRKWRNKEWKSEMRDWWLWLLFFLATFLCTFTSVVLCLHVFYVMCGVIVDLVLAAAAVWYTD